MSENERSRPRWLRRGTALKLTFLVLIAAALVVPAAGQTRSASAKACQLEIFSWWTGGGEAAGLTKLVAIWDKANASCKVKNEAVAGGAGSNAKAVLQQRLAAHDPPDSFQGHAGAELRDYIKAGQLEPIDFVYKQYGFNKVMPKLLISQIKYQGHLWSVPENIHRANVLWFNPKVLRQAGIKPPSTDKSYTWGQFIAALNKAKAAGVIPLSMGEQWTSDHLWETVVIGVFGPGGWTKLWKPGSSSMWHSKKMTTALNRYKQLLSYTNSDAASLTWQDAGKLVADGKAAFNIMGDWQDGYFSGSKAGDNLALKPGRDYGWTAVPGTSGVYDWLSDSFTLPKGAPHRDAAIKWLAFLGSKKAQDTFNPVKGSIPARQDANPRLYGTYLKWALKQWKKDTLAGSYWHGVVSPAAWTADIDKALGFFLQNKDVPKFQSALVTASNKNAK